MLDIKFVRENPDVVKENIRKKFQDQKIPMVDEVIALDQENRNIKQEVESLRANKNKISKQIGALMAQGKKEEAEEVKKEVAASGAKIDELSAREKEVEEKIKTIMMTIPNIIDPSVPVGKDDSENVEIERFGEPVVPDYEVPYHAEIMESFDGLDPFPVRDTGSLFFAARVFISHVLTTAVSIWRGHVAVRHPINGATRRCAFKVSGNFFLLSGTSSNRPVNCRNNEVTFHVFHKKIFRFLTETHKNA